MENRDFVLRAAIKEAGYEEDKPTIRQIVLEVAPGELVGLIGPNGAGKSTTIKTILGLMTHVNGEIMLGGKNKRYAYVPEQPIFYEYMTLWEHLHLAASAFGIEERQFAAKAEELLERFRLTEEKHHYPSHFSKGMQQKLMLIIAFLLEPDVYIVDEPFVGLDPRATTDFLKLLEGERERGAGVLMSTHVLDTAERICTGFVLINNGSVVARGSLDDVRNDAGCAKEATLFECFHALT
ncbi:ABC-2 type transport system ATP-binding protein [Paenibacillus endophyticus]|uniref:ABC-2 type transport system ATP-binding protein n=1 Tax=Paenibacillus endophyticus TaxID=1294268 RepID=A0A7W5GAX5_9BACL|nr:ABC transporter ATP-binding protein [Paenibacillus endophyticus]MBB3153190.1 ABC-2 type transport system ATP-binding protein [Paenibacillus endophyticus]